MLGLDVVMTDEYLDQPIPSYPTIVGLTYLDVFSVWNGKIKLISSVSV